MRKTTDSGKKKRHILLIALLAVACIGAAELCASYYFAPDVFYRVTQPVRQLCRAAADLGGQAVSALSAASARAAEATARAAGEAAQWWEDLRSAPEPEEEEIVEEQVAGDPVLTLEAPVLDPAVTELVEREGREVLTGGIIPVFYYNQGDEPWASQPYGRDDIGRYGCGPTAMCMAVASMTETETDPALMAKWAAEHGCWASKSGSYLSIVERTAEGFGLTAQSLEKTPEAVKAALLEGKLLVALMGPGHFTNGGHFILLRGVTLTGNVLVADPNSLERSLLEWDPQVILDELSRSTSNGAPLWALSKTVGET